jgi:hypothetical protein
MNPKSKLASVALGLSLGALLLPPARAQETPRTTTGELDNTVEMFITVTAQVESVDLAKREVVLKSASGHPVTLTVDARVKRLNEIAVGDSVTVSYYASVASEFRAPTDDEKANPLVVLGEATKAGADAAPSAGAVRVYKVVASVEGLDRTDSSITLKGPRGNYHTVKVKYPAKLSELHLGDMIVVTYTEALAVGVTKAAPPPAPPPPAAAATSTPKKA